MVMLTLVRRLITELGLFTAPPKESKPAETRSLLHPAIGGAVEATCYRSGVRDEAGKIGFELLLDGVDRQAQAVCQPVAQPAHLQLEEPRHTQWKAYLCWNIAQSMLDVGRGLQEFNAGGTDQLGSREALVSEALRSDCTVDVLLSMNDKADKITARPLFKTESLRRVKAEVPFLGMLPWRVILSDLFICVEQCDTYDDLQTQLASIMNLYQVEVHRVGSVTIYR